MAHFHTLEEKELELTLKDLSDWKLVDGKLTASFTFKDFRTAFAFITLVAIEAEKADHHPQWSNAYGSVDFAFSTHDAGDKITNLDVEMAEYISETAKKFSS